MSRVYHVHIFCTHIESALNISDEDSDQDVEMEEVDDDDDSASISNIPDPYDMVYSKFPTETHKLKSVEDCTR